MTKSFHDLQKDTEEDVLTNSLTRIHGRPEWMQMVKMIKESAKIACKFKVSYDWSGNYGLQAIILGAAKYAARYPTLPAYTQPNQPAASATIAGNASNALVRNETDRHEQQLKDWAVVCGFNAGMGKLIRDALDNDIVSALDHAETGFIDVWPHQYFNHLESEWCPLDHKAFSQVEKYFKRGWNRAENERVAKFAERLDQEQVAFQREGVAISDDNKFRHYMDEIYSSGAFSHDSIKNWVSQGIAAQTYANARNYFEEDARAMENVKRLTNSTDGGHGFGTAMSAVELKNLGDTIRDTLKDTITAAVAAEITQQNPSANIQQANSISQLQTESNSLKAKLDNLTNIITQLRNDVRAIPNNSGGGRATPAAQPTINKESDPHPEYGAWTSNWPEKAWARKKKTWWWRVYKEKDPAGYKESQKKKLQAQLDKLNE